MKSGSCQTVRRHRCLSAKPNGVTSKKATTLTFIAMRSLNYMLQMVLVSYVSAYSLHVHLEIKRLIKFMVF